MITVEKRLVPRFDAIPFTFFNSDSAPVHIVSEDASTRSARFSKNHEGELSKATGGVFKLHNKNLKIHKFRLPSSTQRADACIVEYEASVENAWESLKRYFSQTWDSFTAIKPEDEARQRYHKPGLFKHLFQQLVSGRISRIHLYEAQERYVNLQRSLDYYEHSSEEYPVEQKKAKACIRICRRALDSASVLLTRRQHDLNFLWREMIQVQSILLETVVPDKELPAYLDNCEIEAQKLGLTKDPAITHKIQRISELNDTHGNYRNEMVRLLRGLIEYMTSIRTGRIHEQFVNVRNYKKAILFLIPIVILLVANDDLVLQDKISSTEWPSWKPACEKQLFTYCSFERLLSLPAFLVDLGQTLLASNKIAFVLFAGLLGGFFSVAIGLRSRELVPGEDVYFGWYVLTKPWLGAVGAATFFILLNAGFVSLNMGNDDSQFLDQIQQIGPEMFGFAFLAGFSERIVFPGLR